MTGDSVVVTSNQIASTQYTLEPMKNLINCMWKEFTPHIDKYIVL